MIYIAKVVTNTVHNSTYIHLLTMRHVTEKVGVIAIDLSNAATSICRNLLLGKQKAYGLSESAIRLARSYLSEWKQHVKYSSIYSDWLPVWCEVRQGSLLRPLLINIFINDITDVIVNIATLRL